MEGERIFLRSNAQFKLKAGKWRFPKSLIFNPAIKNVIELFWGAY